MSFSIFTDFFKSGFKGGIHPSDSKKMTRDKFIESIPLPDRVVIPCSQHVGAPAKLFVAKGDHVEKGQLIGEAAGFVSVPVHASISGEIKKVAPFPHPSGTDMMAVEIASDGRDTWDLSLKETRIPDSLSAEEIKKRIAAAGIVGLGGAAFPTHVKLSPPKEKQIDALILNGAECEPYLTADHRLMTELANEIIDGMKLMMKVLGVKKGFVGIEDNKPEAIAAMMVAAHQTNIDVVGLHVKYPQGAERQLIKALIDKEVPSGSLPMDVGVVVQNAGTAFAVFEAVKYGRPLVERIATVTGNGIKEPKNLRIKIGTPIEDLIKACGGLTDNVSKIIMGGPMMGLGQYSTDTPVVKGTSGILVMTRDDIRDREAQPCIRCGRCAKACPALLEPGAMGIFSEREMFDKAEEYNVMDCIECGCCAFTCPSDRPLVQLFRYAKSSIIKKRKKERTM